MALVGRAFTELLPRAAASAYWRDNTRPWLEGLLRSHSLMAVKDDIEADQVTTPHRSFNG
jgi:hypothetical protein